MRNINWKDVGKTAGRICKFVAASLALTAVYKVSDCIGNKLDGLTATYDGAVKAIMDSTMFSSDKRTAVAALKRDETAEFYKAIIQVTNSNMFTSDKIKMIRELSES